MEFSLVNLPSLKKRIRGGNMLDIFSRSLLVSLFYEQINPSAL